MDLNVLPCFAICNPANSGRAKAEFAGKFLQRPSAFPQSANSQSIILGYFRAVMFGAGASWSHQNSVGMNLIGRVSYIFQIRKAVVALVSIFVVDLMKPRKRPHESGHHKPVN